MADVPANMGHSSSLPLPLSPLLLLQHNTRVAISDSHYTEDNDEHAF